MSDLDVIDATSLLLLRSLAIADLIRTCDPDLLNKSTLRTAGNDLLDLLTEAKDLIDGKTEVQS